MISVAVSASALAHGMHYALLGAGLVGLLALLGPQLVRHPRRSARSARDDHTYRVSVLGEKIEAGSLGSTLTVPEVLAPRPTAVDPRGSFLLPAAVVSSAAAAGVHAALGPAHFSEQPVFGLYFAGAALAQLLWAVAMMTRPSRMLLELAVIGNTAAVVLWVLTRTVGLGALMPTPEPVGSWDLACIAWEATLVLACIRLLGEDRSGAARLRLPSWASWPITARAWSLGSVLALALLSLFGTHG